MERLNRILLIVILCSLSLFSSPLPSMAEGIVLASTSLAGAIAKAAGAKEVRVLTPKQMRHPPEYDLKPSDLLKFEGVDIVVYGGYERMVAKLLETSQNKKVLVIQIETADLSANAGPIWTDKTTRINIPKAIDFFIFLPPKNIGCYALNILDLEH